MYEKQLQSAAGHLAAHDPILAPIIAQAGLPTIHPTTDYYWQLVDAIISQQLSIKAAATIEKRFLALFDGVPQPEQILAKSEDELRQVGMSGAKTRYVRDLAEHIRNGTLKVDQLPNLSNAEVIQELTAVKGIGEWTAHMFLIFALGRLDVLPVGDLGIRSGMQKLYGLAELPMPTQIQEIAATYHWHPFESVAAWYVWRATEA